MRPLRIAILLVTGLGGFSQARASACMTSALSVYDAAGFSCQLGPFNLTGFTYSFVSGTLTIPDSSITVTPFSGPDFFGLTFSSPLFSATGSDSAKYLQAYTWDPAPVRSADDILSDPVTFPGLAQVTTDICKDAAFSGAVCPTSIATLTVFDKGTSSKLTDSVAFSPLISIAGMRNTIEIDGNGASASFTSYTNELFIVPEPGTLLAGLLGLALSGCLGLKRR